MKQQAELWERLQQALDERRDPFDDPVLESWLLEDDEALDEVLRMRAVLEAVQNETPAVPRGWGRSLALAAGLVGLLIGAGSVLEAALAPSPAPTFVTPVVAQLNSDTAADRILNVSISVVTESESERVETSFDGHEFTRQRDRIAEVTSLAFAPGPATVISTLVSLRLTP